MSRMKATTVLVLLLLVIVGAIAFWGETPGGFKRPVARRTGAEPARSSLGRPKKIVVLYFSAADQRILQEETREILGGGTATEDAKRTLAELLKGPESDLMQTIPRAAQVRNLFIDSSGTAYADFDRELKQGHRADMKEELCSVFSIVGTLASNFPQIQRVQILVEGAEVPTLAGNVDTSMPLSPRYVF